MWTRARWLLKASPSDYMLAMSVASASLPVIGKHLEPLGAVTATGVWGYRHLPDFLGATAKSWLSPGNAEQRRVRRDSTHAVTAAALRGIVNAKDLEIEWPAPEKVPPLWKMREHRRNVHRTSVQYGPRPSQLLDVWRRKDLPAEPAPVLIFVPGGAWVHGSRLLQGYALMSHLAELGWVCLSIDYRVAPHHPWPSHITDVKTAIAWARANVDKFGGDRNFVDDRRHLGRWPPGRPRRSDRQRPGDAERTAGGVGHVGGRRRGHLRPVRLGGSLDGRAGAVRRLPRARGGQAQDRQASRHLPQRVADCIACTPMRRRSSSSTAPATASSPSRRPAVSSSGCVRPLIRW